MAHVVVLGAGIGGMPAAYELRKALAKEHRVTVVNRGENFHFVPSNPWVAVNWRKRNDIEFGAGKYLAKKGIEFVPTGAKRLHPEENRIELEDGRSVGYDYLVIATGPKLAFDEIEGLGGPKAIPSRSVTWITQCWRAKPGGASSQIRGRSWSARCRAPRATARRTNSRSSWTPS